MVAVFAANACGQAIAPQGQPKMTLVEPPAPLLPQSFAGLNAQSITHADSENIDATLSSGNSEFFDPKTCLPVVPSGVAAAPHPISLAAEYCGQILKEDGPRRLAQGRYYLQGAAGPTVDVWVFEFGDATGAYSAYTFYRTLLKPERITPGPAKSTDETTSDADGTLVWAGTAVVRIKGRLTKEQQSALMAGMPKASGRRALAPLLPTMLPAEAGGAKLDPASVRYALGPVAYKTMEGVLPPDILGWDKSLEAATAGYAGKGGKGTLTLLMYPTPQIAGDRGRAVEQVVNAQLAGQDAKTLGTVKMRRVGPLVGVVSGGLQPARAEALVQAVHLQEIVTFDQKMPLELHAEFRKTATLLQSIVVFTGIAILAAVVIAVFLGGARAGIRVLQGKSAASDPEFLTINLRDKPKALFVPKSEKDAAPSEPPA